MYFISLPVSNGQLLRPCVHVRVLRTICVWAVDPAVFVVEEIHNDVANGQFYWLDRLLLLLIIIIIICVINYY